MQVNVANYLKSKIAQTARINGIDLKNIEAVKAACRPYLKQWAAEALYATGQ